MNMNNQIKYPVVEQFVSINGEGTKAGELAVFIRFKGCNLNCSYCDTQWANRQDTPAVEKTAAELVADVCRTGIDNVTMTGGEPLLQTELAGLIKELLSAGKAVEIETNGSVSLENVRAQVKHLTQERQSMERLSMTMDYKLAGSGMETFMRLQNFPNYSRRIPSNLWRAALKIWKDTADNTGIWIDTEMSCIHQPGIWCD